MRRQGMCGARDKDIRNTIISFLIFVNLNASRPVTHLPLIECTPIHIHLDLDAHIENYEFI